MGLRAGKGAASAYRRGADVWKNRRAALVARPDALSVRALEESSNLDAMVAIDVKVKGRLGEVGMCQLSRVEMDGRMRELSEELGTSLSSRTN